MNKAFEQLEVFIIAMITPQEEALHPQHDEQMAHLAQKVISESDNLRQYITSVAANGGSREDFSLFIHNSQAMLTDVLDYVYDARLAATDAALITLYDRVEVALDNVFCLFTHRFKEFFNLDGVVPLARQQACITELEYVLPYLRMQLGTKLPGYALPGIALEPIVDFIRSAGCRKPTYRLMAFITALCRQLELWASSEVKKEDPEWDFMALVAGMNVNSEAGAAFLRDYFFGALGQAGSVRAKMDVLDGFNRKLCFIYHDSSMSYRPGVEPLKTSLQQMVATEMMVVEKAWLAECCAPQPPGPLPLDEKLKSAFSVLLEGVWMRAAIYAGRWKSRDVGKMMHTWSHFVESKQQPDISHTSMQGKSGPSAKLKKSEKKLLQDVLYGMLRYVNSL